MYGYVESAIGFGLMIGPVIGQALFSLLDFEFTFYCTSAILVIPMILTITMVPARLNKPRERTDSMTSSQRREKDRKITLKMMFTNQRVVMACVSSIMAMVIMLFYDTIYSDRLIEIGVSEHLVGNLVFLFNNLNRLHNGSWLSIVHTINTCGWLVS